MSGERGYQHDFSTLHPDCMYDEGARLRKAQTMVAVLRDYFGERLAACRLLDIGCSTGFLSNHLSDHVAHATGIDIDEGAVAHARERFVKPNLSYSVGDAMHTGLDANGFDVVICAQIYEHVPDAAQLLREIRRVLKPGGVCYFAANNRLDPWEHHYHLPLLSVIPRSWGHVYLRLAGKGTFYYEKHLTYWTLRRMARDFELIDYTGKLINDPERFLVQYMVKPGSIKQRLGLWVLRYAYGFFPGYIWLLRKP